MVIYKITNTLNNKVYIGQTSTTIEARWRLHVRHALVERRTTRFCNAIRKYGVDVFTIEVLYDDVAVEDANNCEIAVISEHDATNPSKGYNISVGGTGGFTDDMRLRAAQVRKQRGISVEHQQALLEGAKRYRDIHGPRELSIKQRNHISERMKQYYVDNPEYHREVADRNRKLAKSGKEHPMYGHHHTSDVKDKMSAAKRGKTYDQIFGVEHAQRMREAKALLTGNLNPNYADVDVQILQILTADPRITRQKLAKVVGISTTTLTNRFKKLLGVDNFQRFRYGKLDCELQSFFKGKLNDYMVSCPQQHSDPSE